MVIEESYREWFGSRRPRSEHRSFSQAKAWRSQAYLTSRSPAHPDPNSVGGLIHPTTEVTPLEGTTARWKGFCLIMLSHKSVVRSKGYRKLLRFQKYCWNNRNAYFYNLCLFPHGRSPHCTFMCIHLHNVYGVRSLQAFGNVAFLLVWLTTSPFALWDLVFLS